MSCALIGRSTVRHRVLQPCACAAKAWGPPVLRSPTTIARGSIIIAPFVGDCVRWVACSFDMKFCSRATFVGRLNYLSQTAWQNKSRSSRDRKRVVTRGYTDGDWQLHLKYGIAKFRTRFSLSGDRQWRWPTGVSFISWGLLSRLNAAAAALRHRSRAESSALCEVQLGSEWKAATHGKYTCCRTIIYMLQCFNVLLT